MVLSNVARLFLLVWGTTCCFQSHVSSQEEVFVARRNPYRDLAAIPQFVTLTLDGSISPETHDLVKDVLQVKDRNGCGIKATFFVSDQGATQCELVNALRTGLHEIATQTIDGYPSIDQISQAVDWLSTECGVPREELRGFRAPLLQYNQETLDQLSQLGLLYDSSITMCAGDAQSDFGRNYFWPFTFDDISVQKFFCDPGCSDCGSTRIFQPNPGLWEMPLWVHYFGDSATSKSTAMDYQTDDLQGLLEASLQRRLEGNRAPLGISVQSSWMQANGDVLKTWMESVLERYEDVHFVTNYELIQWLRSPTPVYEPQCDGANPEVLAVDASASTSAPTQSPILNGTDLGPTTSPPSAALEAVAVDADVSTLAPTQSPTLKDTESEPTTRPPSAAPSASPTDLEGCCTWDYGTCLGPGDCRKNPANCEECGGVWVDEIPEVGCSAFTQHCDDYSFCCRGLTCQLLGDGPLSTCIVVPPTPPPSQQPTASPTPPTLPIDQLPYKGIAFVFDELQDDMDNLFLSQTSDGSWQPSSMYKTEGFMNALEVLYQHGVDDDTIIYLGNDDDQKSYRYGLVNLAAFLSQLMSENIKFDACSEVSWNNNTEAAYPLRNRCGLMEPLELYSTCSVDIACSTDGDSACACVLGKLNNELGRRAKEENRWSKYPHVDFCQEYGSTCRNDEFRELKWLVAIQSWVDGVQSFEVGGWNYVDELHRFVDGGYSDQAFIHTVSGIVTQDCRNPPCGAPNATVADDYRERAEHFDQILDLYAELLPTIIENRGVVQTSLASCRGYSFWASCGIVALLLKH